MTTDSTKPSHDWHMTDDLPAEALSSAQGGGGALATGVSAEAVSLMVDGLRLSGSAAKVVAVLIK